MEVGEVDRSPLAGTCPETGQKAPRLHVADGPDERQDRASRGAGWDGGAIDGWAIMTNNGHCL
jgi:hypothetical protein